MVFHDDGARAIIYLPSGWSGPMREAVIVQMMERITVDRWGEALIQSKWDAIVAPSPVVTSTD